MTRDEFAWLVVRAVGAFVLLLIALDLITLILTSLQAFFLHEDLMSNSFNQDEVIHLSIRYGRYIEQIWYLGAKVLLKSLFAYYCFFRGLWVQKLLTSRLPSTESLERPGHGRLQPVAW